MLRLTLILHTFIGATLSGMAVVAALVTGHDTLWPILVAAVVGFLVAFPVSYLFAKQIS